MRRGDGSGYFVPVTIIDNRTEDSRMVAEEAFGLVLPLLKFCERERSDCARRKRAVRLGWFRLVEGSRPRTRQGQTA